MAAFADCARTLDAPAFAFHTSEFMTTARALYKRLGYRRAPAFDIDVNVHYRIDAPRSWTALGYLNFCLLLTPREQSPSRIGETP